MAKITFDLHSPERGWEPFLAWLRENGIEPNRTVAVTVDLEAMTAAATRQVVDDEGRPVIDHRQNCVVTEDIEVAVNHAPPRRT